jgi:tRNA pseudouridine38-40 synthase
MRVLRLLVQYDGTGFVGWQRQESGESIQRLLEAALERIEGRHVTVHGAGRTDAGVHALGQVASVRLESPLDEATLARALNANLPETIRVMDVRAVADDFHARFSARSKTYEYRIWNGPACPPFERLYVWHIPQPLDLEAMQAASASIVGTHDFAVFQGSGAIMRTTVRTVTEAGWHSVADERLVFTISGDGFLRHMVRSIVGTLVEVGRGWRARDDVARLLEGGARTDVGRTAPATGLFLVCVEYGSTMGES